MVPVSTIRDDRTVKDCLTVQANGAQELNAQPSLPALRNEVSSVPDLRPRIHEVPLRYKTIVDAKVVIVSQAMQAEDLNMFHQSLANGLTCEAQVEAIGKMPSVRSLYRWIADFKRDGAIGLCPQHSVESGRGRKVPEDVQNKLLKILLNPNKIAVATAVNLVKDHYRVQKKEIGCSYRTMLRWVEDWKLDHLEEWTLAREGMKAYREKVNRTVLRDWSLVSVGDCWISDGHTIEVMLIDPRDGKPRKHEIIAWFDASSRMPVGAAINLTENTEVIQLSFRNAALFCGYKPLVVYVDNGKAYKGKYFSGSKKSAEDIEIEIQGVFARLGIEVVNSLPYNAKAKTIERWWQDLQNQVERLMPGWTGNHAMAKPANMARDEKWQKQQFPHKAVTIEQFKEIFEYWAINIYGSKPHPEYKDKTRLEVFNEGSAAIPHERRISPEELNHMLMVIEKKRITNQGITINKTIYWDEALVRYVGRDLIVRWDFWDIRSILVYDEKDQFICQAPMRRFQDPLVKLRGDESIAKRSLEADLADVKRIERQAKQSTNELLKRVSDATNDMVDSLPMPEIGLIDERPLMPSLPIKEESIDDKIAKLDIPASTPEEPKDGISEATRKELKSIGIDI